MSELKISDDVRDLVDIERRQCQRSSAAINLNEEDLKSDVLKLIQQIEVRLYQRSSFGSIFQRLRLADSICCGEGMECLEREIRDRVAQK
jgi:hypothetical protein